MPPRTRGPVVRSVQTSDALAALRAWLNTLPTRSRESGELYFTNKHVQKVWAGADHFVEARVLGQELYSVTLFLTRNKWSSRCTCPATTDCKHVYAAGRAWIAENEAPATSPLLRLEEVPAPESSSATTSVPPFPSLATPPGVRHRPGG